MKKTVNLKVEDVDKEWNETLQAIPSIREQLQARINNVISQGEITDQDIIDLDNAFSCIQRQLSYFPTAIKSYARRCAKVPGLDTAENLDRLKEIRESSESIMEDFDSMRESAFRKLSLRRMEQGIFTLPQPEQQQKDAQFPSAPDEESGE